MFYTFTGLLGNRLRQRPSLINTSLNPLNSVISIDVFNYISASTNLSSLTSNISLDVAVSLDSYPSLVLDSNPVAYWRLEETSGTSFADYSTSGYTLTHTTAPTLGQFPLIKEGYSAKYVNNVDTRGYTGTAAGLNFGSGNWTLEFFYTHGTTASSTIPLLGSGGNWGSNGAIGVFSYHVNNGNYLQIWNYASGDSVDIISNTSLIVDRTYHVVFRRNGSSLELYLDGELDTSTTTSTTWNFNDQNDTVLGGSNWEAYYADGYIDEVSFYSTALSTSIIKEHYLIGNRKLIQSAIDYTNTISNNLAFLILFDGSGRAFDLVSGNKLSYAGTDSTRYIDGIPSSNIDGTDFYSLEHNTNIPVDGNYTLAWYGILDSLANFQHFFGKHSGNGTSDNPYDIRTDSGNFRFVSNYITDYSFSTSTSTGRNIWTLSHTDDTANILSTAYVNGTKTQNAVNVGASYTDTGNTEPLRIGRRTDGAVQLDGGLSLVAGWNEDFSDQKHEDFHITPFKLLKPDRYYYEIIKDTPIAYFKLDETYGNIAGDRVSNSDGTYNGTYTLGQTPLTINGSSVSLTTDGYVSLGTRSDLNFGNADWSVEFIVSKASTDGNFNVVIGNNPGSWTTDAIHIDFDNHTANGGAEVMRIIVFSYNDNSGGNVIARSSVLSQNTSHHIIIRRDGSNLEIYVNGVLDGSATISGAWNFNTGGTYLGTDIFDGASSYYHGKLDEVSFYNYALTPSQISNHYNTSV